MVISEMEGKVDGFSFENGVLLVNVFSFVPHCVSYGEQNYCFHFNRNAPETISLEKFWKKKVRITVELLDE